ncbi:condensation domain-containing protein [Salininema proteolyticum]|uniref:Condensation domain-containing protein n=1 Tax=Salininema proteolyticum TaxID=1607685 RepID=A0ABV8U1C4_9ACTN
MNTETEDVITVHAAERRPQSGPATWGQYAIWKELVRRGEEEHLFNLDWVVDLPEGTTDDGLAATVRDLVRRQESLRTVFQETGEGDVVQTSLPSAAVPWHRMTSPPDSADDAIRRAAAESRTVRFRHGSEPPLRVITCGPENRPIRAALVVSHLATDFNGLRILAGEWSDLLAGKTLDDLPPATSPLRLAEWQASPEGLDRREKSASHWVECFRSTPDMNPRPDLADRRDPVYWTGTLTSPAIASALTPLAEANGVSTTAVLLAAAATALGDVTGSTHPMFMLMCHNRTRKPFRDCVSPVALEGAFAVDLSGGGPPYSKAWKACLAAYRNAQYHKGELRRHLSESGAEPAGLKGRCWFNDLRFELNPPPAEAATETASSFAWTAKAHNRGTEDLAFHVRDSPGSVEVALTARTDYFGPDAIRDCLAVFESVAAGTTAH